MGGLLPSHPFNITLPPMSSTMSHIGARLQILKHKELVKYVLNSYASICRP